MKKLSEKILYDAKWLKLKEGVFLNEHNIKYIWETVEIKNHSSSVIIIPKLVPSNRIVFVKQYRPPIENYVIGFPAGLAKTEDYSKEALRELKEETGYTGKIVEMSPSLKVNSGITDSDVRIFKSEIDESEEANIDVKQELEDSEEISVHLVHVNDVKQFLDEQIKSGCDIAICVWNYFFGEKL